MVVDCERDDGTGVETRVEVEEREAVPLLRAGLLESVLDVAEDREAIDAAYMRVQG